MYKGPPYVPLFNTRMRECRDVDFIFRAASLPQYTLVTGNAASRFANRILSDADPNLRKIPSRIADQGYHVRASSVGSNEFFFGNLCPLCHFYECRCGDVRFQGRFEVILLREAGASPVLRPLVNPKVVVLRGRGWKLHVGPVLQKPLAAQLIDHRRIKRFL